MNTGNFISRPKAGIRFSVFLASILLKKREKYQKFDIILALFSELQLLTFLLTNFLDYHHQDSQALSIYLHRVISWVSYKEPATIGIARDIVIFTFLACFNFVILGIFTILLGCHVLRRRVHPVIINLWNMLLTLNFSAVTLFVVQYSLTWINDKMDQHNQGLWIALVIIQLIVDLLFGAIGAKLSFIPLQSEHPLGMRTSNLQVLTFIHKVLDTLLYHLIGGIVSKWIRLIAGVIIYAGRLREIWKVPFYHFRSYQMALYLNFSGIMSLLIVFISIIIKAKSDLFAYLVLVTFPMSVRISNIYLNKLVENYTRVKINELQTLDDFYKKGFVINYLLENGAKSNSLTNKKESTELLFLTLVKNHSEACENDECPCHQIVKLEASELSSYPPSVMSSLSFELIEELHVISMERLQDIEEVKLSCANFLLRSKPGSYGTAITLIHGCKNRINRFNLHVLSLHLVETIESLINLSYRDKIDRVDVAKVYDYYSLRDELRNKIKSNIDKFLRFWETYKAGHINLNTLMELNMKIDHEAREISQLWNDIIQSGKIAYSEYMTYIIFLNIVRNSPFTAEKLLQKYMKFLMVTTGESKLNEILNHNIHLPNTVSIFAYMEKDRLGEITYISPQIEQFGYKLEDFKEQNVDYLIPGHYKEIHRQKLVTHIEFGNTNILHKNRYTFIMRKDGFISPINIYIAPVPYLQQRFMYAAFIRPQKTDDQFIAVSELGIVLGCSAGVGEELGIDPTKKEHIRNFCKSYMKILNFAKSLQSKGKESQKKQKNFVSLVSTVMQSMDVKTNKTRFRGIEHEDENHFDPDNDFTNNGVLVKYQSKADQYGYEYNYKTLIKNIGDEDHPIYLLALHPTEESSFLEEESNQDYQGTLERIGTDTENKIPLFTILQSKESLQSKPTFVKLSAKAIDEPNKSWKMQRKEELEEGKLSSLYTKTGTFGIGNRGGFNKDIIDVFKGENKSVVESYAQSSSTGLERNINQYIERAIHTNKTSVGLRALKFSVFLHLVLSITLLILFVVLAKERIRKLGPIAEVSTSNFNRHYYLWIWMYWSNAHLNLLYRGLITGRYGVMGYDLFAWLGGSWEMMAVSLLNYSRQIESSINNFEWDHQREFYQPIRMADRLDPSVFREVDIFTLDNELANACFRLFQQINNPPEDFNYEDPDFEFVMNNVLDDQYIAEENIYRLVQADIKLKLEVVGNLATTSSTVITGLEVLLFLVTMYGEIKFMKKRKLFADVFVQIKEEEINRELILVKNFREALDHSQMPDQLIKYIEKQMVANKKRSKREYFNKRDYTYKAKAANLSGFNTRTYLYMCYVVVFQAIVVVLCVVIFQVLIQGRDNINTQIGRAVEANLLFNKFGTTFLALYEYIRKDGNFTIRNNPVSQEWLSDYEVTTNSLYFFDDLRRTDDQEFLARLDYILTQDLCLFMYDNEACEGAREEARKGLLSLNSFMIKASKAIKNIWDSSNKSEEVMKTLYDDDDMITMEWAYWLYIPPAYQQLEDILKESVYETIHKFDKNSSILIGVFVGSFLLLIKLIWLPIWENFRYERFKLQRMFRVVPIGIIRGNSFIKNYLIANSDNILKPVRNLL